MHSCCMASAGRAAGGVNLMQVKALGSGDRQFNVMLFMSG